MRFTLDTIMELLGIKQEDTVYSLDAPAVRQYVVSSGDFYTAVTESAESAVYGTSGNQTLLAGKIDWKAADYYTKRLSDIKTKLKLLKNDVEDITHAHADEIRALRNEKKRLTKLLENTSSPQKQMIEFKNSLCAISFAALCRYIPCFSGVSFRDAFAMPWFAAKMPMLKAAVEQRRPIGISGGPCLFGVNEMLVKVALTDGTIYEYDFSSGRRFAKDSDATGLEEAIAYFGDRVCAVDFVNQKTGVTTQEYDSIHCLFECAAALEAKLAIPLPDMSYIKYLDNILDSVPKSVKDAAMAKFCREAYLISDMYLSVIEKLRYMYPHVHTAVVHGRDEKLCRIFYEKRKPYLTETAVRRLTGNIEKTDSVQDYITMPALPYYLWGITDIIQIDSLDETDSYRKCAKIHKGVIKLYGLLYPERISGDGIHTIFYAPLQYKEYLT